MSAATKTASVKGAKFGGIVAYPTMLYRLGLVSGEYVWWEAQYRGRFCYFVTRRGATPSKSPNVWWKTLDAAMEAEHTSTPNLVTMDRLRADAE